jgi:hypothetical protein
MVVGCGGASKPAQQPPVIANQFLCSAPPVSNPNVAAPLPDRKPPAAGEKSPEYVAAKRLFDAEKWAEARQALENVTKGKDDEGNRQNAEYYLAVAIFKSGDESGALPSFLKIASNRNHIKNAEALLWLTKFGIHQPNSIQLSWFATYEEPDIVQFENPQMRELFEMLAFYMGRRMYQEGQLDRAMALFSRIDPNNGYYGASKQCLDQIAAAKAAAWTAKRNQQDK